MDPVIHLFADQKHAGKEGELRIGTFADADRFTVELSEGRFTPVQQGLVFLSRRRDARPAPASGSKARWGSVWYQ